MRIFILGMLLFIAPIGFAQKVKNFFPAKNKDVMDLINSMASITKAKYVLTESTPVDNPDYFKYSDGHDTIIFFVSKAKWRPGAVPIVPPDTLTHYYIEGIQGPREAIFQIWKKYYSPEATEEQIPSLSRILDDTGISGVIISEMRGDYYQIHSSFDPIYKLKTFREGGR